MLRKNLTLLVGSAVAIAAIAVDASEAHAFRFWSGSSSSSSGSSGGWGSSSSGSSGSWGSSSSSSGSSGGWLANLHYRKAARHYAGSHSSGSSGSSSSSSGSWGGYSSSSSSSGSSGSSGGWMPATPAEPAAPTGDGSEGSTTYYRGNSATLSVSVPADAKVFVNDAATRSLGEQRRYVSRGLQPGRTYTYNVRVEFEKDGQMVTETKSVRLTAGGEADLSFDGSSTGDKDQVADTPVETKLTLNLPADAKVVLAGNATKMTGSTRTFTTKKLSSGQEWSDYVVSVTIERDGRPVTEERTITLTAGEPQELTFTFDADKIASTAR